MKQARCAGRFATRKVYTPRTLKAWRATIMATVQKTGIRMSLAARSIQHTKKNFTGLSVVLTLSHFNQRPKEDYMKASDKGGGEFEQAPTGTHAARCIKLIDLGTQKGEYQGVPNLKHKIIIGWELPLSLMTTGDYAGKPFTVTRFYMLSLSEKATLRADLKSWRGRDFTAEELAGFEVRNILDKGCMLSIAPNKKGKAEVVAIMGLPQGLQLPPRVNELTYFSLDRAEFVRADFEKLSDGIKKMITASPEWAQLNNPQGYAEQEQQAPADNFDDDIPF